MVGLLIACVKHNLAATGQTEAGANWALFGLVMVLLFAFGVWFGWLVRWLALHGVDGQTAYMVVTGTFVTLIGAGILIGWHAAAVVFCCFAASGLPMVLEYVSRVHALRVHDQKEADDLAKGLLK